MSSISLDQGSNIGDVQLNAVSAGGLRIGSTKFGGANVGVCGANSWIEVSSAGPPRVIVFARHCPAVGTDAAGKDMHGFTTDAATVGTVSTVGTITDVLDVPVLPITARPGKSLPAGKYWLRPMLLTLLPS